MNELGQRTVAILVVNGAIGLIQWLVRKQIPALGRGVHAGLICILLPIGFGLYGWDMPHWFTSMFVVGGLAQLLHSVKRTLAAVSAVD